MLSDKNKAGKVMLIIGFTFFVIGVIFNKTMGLVGTPAFLESISFSLIIVGIITIIASNFFNKNSENKA